MSLGQDGPSAATYPSPHGLRQLQPKKKRERAIVLSTHPESKHSIQSTFDTAWGPCPRGAYCQSQSACTGRGRQEPNLNLRRTLHNHNLEAVADQVRLPYETYKSFLVSPKAAASSVLLSSPSLPGECPLSASKLGAARGPWPPLSRGPAQSLHIRGAYSRQAGSLVKSNPPYPPPHLPHCSVPWTKPPSLGLNTAVMGTITRSWASVFGEACGVQKKRGNEQLCFNQTLGAGEILRGDRGPLE